MVEMSVTHAGLVWLLSNQRPEEGSIVVPLIAGDRDRTAVKVPEPLAHRYIAEHAAQRDARRKEKAPL